MTHLSQLAVGDYALDATVLDQNGQPVMLASQWERGPILLTFLRHFG